MPEKRSRNWSLPTKLVGSIISPRAAPACPCATTATVTESGASAATERMASSDVHCRRPNRRGHLKMAQRRK
eukprot:10479524-Heterocapsa_arctica.AAC.1